MVFFRLNTPPPITRCLDPVNLILTRRDPGFYPDTPWRHRGILTFEVYQVILKGFSLQINNICRDSIPLSVVTCAITKDSMMT